jgi:hypothetical protein
MDVLGNWLRSKQPPRCPGALSSRTFKFHEDGYSHRFLLTHPIRPIQIGQ